MTNERVLWEEGMFLGPQHFQAWERHLFHQVRGRFAAVFPLGWGLTSLSIDEGALALGEFAIKRLSGVLRDGTSFDAPDADSLPAMRPFAKSFETEARQLGVYLAVRDSRPGFLLTKEDDANSVGRYRRREPAIADELSGIVERNVAVGELDLRLRVDGDSMEGFQTLQIARIVRHGQGFALDEKFIPTCLVAGASEALCGILRRVTRLWAGKSTFLTQNRQQQMAGTIQFSATDAANYWLLHSINTALPVVAHHARQPVAHPEQIYRVLASMAGSLCTYHIGKEATQIPPYDHSDLSSTFGFLADWLDALPGTVLPESCIPIPMATYRDVFQGTIPETVPANGEFYLAVKCEAPLDRILSLPKQVKIGSPDRVENCRNSALPGVDMLHDPSPPTDIRRTAGFHYFRLNRQHRFWDEMRQNATLCVFVPEVYRDVQLECIVVKPGRGQV